MTIWIAKCYRPGKPRNSRFRDISVHARADCLRKKSGTAVDDQLIEERRGDLLLSTDRNLIDIDAVHAMLRASHWAGAMTRDQLVRAVANSVTIGIYDLGRQIAFGRAVSDLSTYAYLTDIIVAETARGLRIGRWMIETFVRHPDLQGLRRFALWTRSAAPFYEQLGFHRPGHSSTYMELEIIR